MKNKEPKNAMEEEGCKGCLYRKDPSGKGWCYFWGKPPCSIDKFPCWRKVKDTRTLQEIMNEENEKG